MNENKINYYAIIPATVRYKGKISKDFLTQLERLEFVYTEETLKFMSLDNIQKLKEIIYPDLLISLIFLLLLPYLYIKFKNLI